ncbi:hypothetical protein HDU83_002546 [Entophlyctis luteolus]|nr:hypothetical protein HDU82_005977 [Entophlyctis luteolus]KAJ3346949.1 hypothetical protein HDU83_002546 [Entophlyctis luteolus]KAJ3386629.1 hypothetical protein HDU84_001377 [Entophlyctis sp. JEL0112]
MQQNPLKLTIALSRTFILKTPASRKPSAAMFSFMKKSSPATPMDDQNYCTATGCAPNELSARPNFDGFPVIGDESIMDKKENGSCAVPPMKDLLFGVSYEVTNRICCFNRHYAEHSGYFLQTQWLDSVSKTEATTYYDPITGKPLFRAPIGRSFDEFLQESKSHGWPSFRDQEVVWDNVRVVGDGECVSTAGTHLGHNIPDRKGNRYCINLVSISGQKVSSEQ